MEEICILSLRGQATSEQERELAAWREASPGNEMRFQEVRRLWEFTGALGEVDDSRPVPSASEFLRASGRRPPIKARRRPRWIGWMAAAAGVILSLWVGHSWNFGEVALDAPVDAEFRTGSGELATAALGDGTVVRVAPNSRLVVSFTADRRTLHLDGKAFFSVAADPTRPLEVQSSQGRVLVLGTRFEAATSDDEITVLVLQGLVGVEVGRNQLELQAGDLGHAAGGSIRSVRRVENPEELQDWLGVFLAFEATPLSQVTRELEARLGVRLELAGPDLEDRTVTGWFTDEDGHEVADVICRIAHLSCAVDGDVIHASPL